MVFVFHRPVASSNGGEPMVADLAFFQTGDEVAGLDFGLAADLGLPMPGEAANLPGVGKEAHVQIKGRDAEFPVLDATVSTFGFGTPADGEVIESFPR